MQLHNLNNTDKKIYDFLVHFGHQHFDIGVLTPTGKMINHYKTTLENVIKMIKYLKYSNSKHAHIYFRPSWPHTFIMLDDIKNPKPLINIAYTIVKTSAFNFQVWLKLDQITFSRQHHKEICKYFAKKYNADPASADPTHYGRLPGFYNKKHKYHPAYPLVQCVYMSNTTIPLPQLQSDKITFLKHTSTYNNHIIKNLENIYDQLEKIYDYYSNTVGKDKSQSEADYYFAKFCLHKMKLNSKIIEDFIATKRTDKRDNIYYAKLTVSKLT